MAENYQNLHPFGMNPTDDQIAESVIEARSVYKGSPSTTCCSLAECCKAGMPNLYYSEFLSIRRGAVDKMTKEERTNLTVECIRRYLTHQTKKKPCAFLGGNNLCTIYDVRPLKCRLYGLIPNDLYKENAQAVADELNKPLNEVPLYTQCPLVKVDPEFKELYPDGKVPRSAIEKMENRMKSLDRKLGMTKELQDDGFGFLTYHDWHLLYEFGEGWMENLTKLRLKLTDEQKEQFVESIKTALEKKVAEEKGAEDGK